MITARNRDARRSLALGSFGGDRKMEDTELEEGEAYSYHDNDHGFDNGIDPDVSLSYIGEKLQHVLGHFRKDFEGGVSAENLGAKFGGYGSFLPADRRSPVWSHSKSPARGQNYGTPQSTCTSNVEDLRHDSSVSLPTNHMNRDRPVSAATISRTSRKKTNVENSVRQDGCMPPLEAVEYSDSKSANLSDQKMLKVRIKVGADNLATQKRAAIYSGLGLDVSPTSSLEDSPYESEGMSHGPHDTSFESPTSILRMMTSYPVHGNLLLSPLADDLVFFTIKEKHLSDHRTGPTSSADPASSGMGANGINYLKDRKKVICKKKSESLRNTEDLKEAKGGKDSRSSADAAPKKELDVDMLLCEELVSQTLKLPILSNIGTPGDMVKSTHGESYGAHEASTVALDNILSDQAAEENAQPLFSQEPDSLEKPKARGAGKLSRDKKGTAIDDIAVHSRKEAISAEENFQESKPDLCILRGKNGSAERVVHTDSPCEITARKGSYMDKDGFTLPSGKDNPPSNGKEKVKVKNEGAAVADASKESLSGSTSVTKNNKSHSRDSSKSRSGREDPKLAKKPGKGRERYKDFSGDIEGEEESQNQLINMAPEERRKDFSAVEKGISEYDMKKERLSSNGTDMVAASEADYNTNSQLGSGSRNNPTGDAAPPAVDPVLIEENWVGCDKCRKWRLLPFGKNPNDLPEKWVCSMLDWLSGMNRCSVSQEETTRAIYEMFHLPVPDAQEAAPLTSDVMGVNLASYQDSNKNLGSFSPQAVSLSSGEKKKHGIKKPSLPRSKDGPAQTSDSEKKLITSSDNRSLNDANRTCLENEADARRLSKNHDLEAEKHSHKHKIRDRHSSGGDANHLKSCRKRETEPDNLKASKKVKNEGASHAKEDWKSDDGSFTRKIGQSSSSGSPAFVGKNQQSGDQTSLKVSKSNKAEKIQVSAMHPRDKVRDASDNGCFEAGNSNEGELATKKRKKRYIHGSQTGSESLPIIDYEHHDSELPVREIDRKKEKKPRTSRSEGKESDLYKGSSRSDNGGSNMGNQQLEHDLAGVDTDLVKKKAKSSQPVAATSSSSKVCGSRKSRGSLQDTRGSPAESVSSSPIRSSKSGKLASVTRKLKEKYDSQDATLPPIGSPRRCSDVENGGERYAIRNDISAGNAKGRSLPSPEVTNHKSIKDGVDYGLDTSCPSKKQDWDQCSNDRENGDLYPASESHSQKSGRDSSSRVKEKNRSSKYRSDAETTKISSDDFQETLSLKEAKPRDYNIDLQENEHKEIKKKDSTGESRGRTSRGSQSNLRGHEIRDEKLDAGHTWDGPSNSNWDEEKLSTGLASYKADQAGNLSQRGKPLPVPPSGAGHTEIIRSRSVARVPLKGNEAGVAKGDAVEGNGASKAQMKMVEADKENGSQHQSSRHLTSNGNGVRHIDAQSPVRRDSSSQAATKALKEAKDLKHLADRRKSSGERTGLYFQAALKFLHGASLLESSKSDSMKHGEMIQSVQIYGSTAKLCQFCAHEYEKSKDMASAALAYKCMEVAYLKVVYSSNSTASRDRLELLPAFKLNPPDVDNVNNSATADKVAQPKGVSSPQVLGNNLISVRATRLLNFAHDVNNAMEASRKSRVAFGAAKAAAGDAQSKEGISCIKKALDFNFQEVEGLLGLVRLATEAISR
ncbi:cysteine-tryptophan domain-containing zinc finger protein 7-like isoform X2 [Rhodamnia argentea]|uniref:Cysteine-tryptophan domain-containing zinc finger protein 7-like isoform X2 n=1 Tax=Rhodamnia argentea TaxID=178133 RepID=A0A8B8PDA2_9MYRT|nr:cysteine-tryptophan domain-containing zinc finger protein 7-like isoform X2 [Rhodamnia argentea]